MDATCHGREVRTKEMGVNREHGREIMCVGGEVVKREMMESISSSSLLFVR